jgi:hypothetical protein
MNIRSLCRFRDPAFLALIVLNSMRYFDNSGRQPVKL